jgi:GT2 family glycosyltransferase
MRRDYFDLFQSGVVGELALLSLAEKLEYMARYEDLVMVEGLRAAVFANAISIDKDFASSNAAQNVFCRYAVRAHQAMPTHPGLMELLNRLDPKADQALRLDILKKLSLSPDHTARLEARDEEDDAAARGELQSILKNTPAHIGAAAALLQADFNTFSDPDAWLPLFKCPSRLAGLWRQELFLHYARRSLWKRALPLWDQIDEASRGPYALVYAADMHGLAGDAAQALALYHEALRQDPRLFPVRRRVAELESPRRPRPELLRERRTALCVYCWNKGPMLEQTLRALAASDTGNNPVFVLLNGCSDDSRARVDSVRPLFPDRQFHIVDLPINIGAPAARNWLINLPDVRICDHVAFMDDDVIMPKDWLVKYLTAMESDPKNAVVGCKVVFPSAGDEAPVLQYLYRSVSLALEGALKLSVTVPMRNARDTGLYSFTRSCLNVMGCLHLLRNSALREAGDFDIRFSPSQVDDIDHDLCTCLKGYTVVYCGTVTCEHHQRSGVGTNRTGARLSKAALGSILGNDLKLNYKHMDNLETLKALAVKMQVDSRRHFARCLQQ